MSRGWLKLALLLGCLLAALPSGAAGTALIEVEGLVFRADGAFEPRKLPQKRFAPIDFEGFVSLEGRKAVAPPALERAVVDFDHDGRIASGGLPRCAPARIAGLSTQQARRACRGAIIGDGKIEAVILLAGGPVRVSSKLSIFNGPRLGGRPSALLHARTEVPLTQTYAIVVPIARIRGDFRYRVSLDVPPLAAGLGRITGIEIRVGRRYRAGGKRRSYLAARCSDSILRTRGDFRFADGTVIHGAIEKFCAQR